MRHSGRDHGKAAIGTNTGSPAAGVPWPPVFRKGLCYPALRGSIHRSTAPSLQAPRSRESRGAGSRLRAGVCNTLCLENQGCCCSGLKDLHSEVGVSQETAVIPTWPQATDCVPDAMPGTGAPNSPAWDPTAGLTA